MDFGRSQLSLQVGYGIRVSTEFFLYQNGRMCSRRKVRVRAGWIVTARLTESDALYVRDRLEAPRPPVWALRGPWAASRPIAPLRRLACLKCGRLDKW
jgi:hypothetical protein